LASWQLSLSLSPSLCLPTSSRLPSLKATAAEDVRDEAAALAVLERVRGDTGVLVLSAVETVSASSPPKPLITSTLQQEASSLYGMAPKTTMMAAQKLYEAGHITYMRTDQAVLSAEAVGTIRDWVFTTHGAAYLRKEEGEESVGKPKGAKGAKTKTRAAATAEKPEAQAAHEAIRPTHPEKPDVGVEDAAQKTVYALVWRRAVQSQMAPALTNVRKAVVLCVAEEGRRYHVEQTQSRFLGWRVLERVDAKEKDEAFVAWAPHLIAGARLAWTSVNADEHFTKPKPRYTEASLIKDLEDKGIGRPSTFASLVGTIVDREYVEKTSVEGRTQASQHLVLLPPPSSWPPAKRTETHTVGAEKNKVRATALGRSVAEFLTKDYGDLFAYSFTAEMEGKLDAVAKGEAAWKSVLQTTWDTYKERYEAVVSSSSGAGASQRQRVLAPGLKVIQSKKGPLYVREGTTEGTTEGEGKGTTEGEPKSKAVFAALGPGQSYETATAEQASAAFAAKAEGGRGEMLGSHEGFELRKKRGPYGVYVEWNGQRLTVKPEWSLDEIVTALKAKSEVVAFSRVVGEYTIKRGPYGLYFYKHANKKATFVTLPAAVNAETVSAGDLALLYSAGLLAKKKRKP